MIDIDELSAGDVLLCYKDNKLSPAGRSISYVTKSSYTHAAICLDQSTAAESTVKGGVAKIVIKDLISRYDHVAVFRQPDAWRPSERVVAMNQFVETVIGAGAKYNLSGVVKFKNRAEVHQLTLTQQLEAFFNGTYEPAPLESGKYFCSELVANCFVVTGFIAPSAAIVFNSETTSPGDLARDSVFGTFYGYLSSDPDYQVPDTDEFFNGATFNEIFQSQ